MPLFNQLIQLLLPLLANRSCEDATKTLKFSGFHILEENKYELSFKKGVNSTKKIDCLDLENAAGPETTVL